MSKIDKYDQIFCSVFGVDKSELNDSFNFKDVEKWDSMAHLMLISELEEAFDIMFETNDILQFGGYKNGVNILRKYGVDI